MRTAYANPVLQEIPNQAEAPTPLRGLPQSAAVLTYLGALPLIIAALLIVVSPDIYGAAARGFMTVYGGALIVFFGGVRWGVAVMKPNGPTFMSLVGGALPLIAAMPIFVPSDVRFKFAFILIALPVLLLDDLRATRRGSGAPDWYLGVRAPLTILMEFSYLVALAATLRG
ncbi:MAG: DUF3429 domain-containing protein [Amphiplicatus sp.]